MADDRFEVIRNEDDDSNGRPLFMTRYMHAFWRTTVNDLGFTPVVVQGPWMERNGGGASASSHTHDRAGCLDLRTWDRTSTQVTQVIRTCRRLGAGAWLRNQAHGGFEPHIHLVLGGDTSMHPETAAQWESYVAGGDGIGGSDYHRRPSPLVEGFDYDSRLEDDMQLNDPIPLTKRDDGETATIGDALRAALQTREALKNFRAAEFERDQEQIERQKRMRAQFAGLADRLTELGNDIEDTSAKEEIAKLSKQVQKALKASAPT